MIAVMADQASSRVPPRRAGNFHLLAQMKVTKAKGLNTDLCGALGCRPEALFEAPRLSVHCLPDPSSLRDFIGRKALGGTRRRSGVGSRAALLNSAIHRFASLPFNAPAVMLLDQESSKPSEANASRQDDEAAKRRAHAKRKGFRVRGLRKSGALTPQMFGQMCVEALCFGDFHLCQQMKVTRPPGRDPATDNINRPAEGGQASRSQGRTPATPC